MRSAQAGFTLIEVVVSAAIGAVMLWCILAFANRTIASAQALDMRLQASAGAAHEIERLSSEAASALAVYVPAGDVLGNSNADGHEVDLYAQDSSHRPYTWAYRYDADARTITRFTTGAGSAIAGEVVSQIDAFSATAARASDLSAPGSAAYDPLFAGVSAPDVPYAFADNPQAIGGNRLVVLQIVASGVNRRGLLSSADAPTAFTVVVRYTPSPAPIVTATPVPLVLTP